MAMTDVDRIRALLAQRPKAARPLAAVRREPGASWYRIVNQADQPSAEIWLYDEIGAWGVSAGMFVAELTALQVLDITLHVNSPGGDAWDGLAIYNALRTHPARVTVQVDGAAISAASFIAMAGDRIVTAAQSQWMIHEASGLCFGNCDDMTAMAVVLDQMSGMIAEIYNDRVRGGVTKWRNLMRAETWYTADEAVAAGLADDVAALPKRQQDEALAASARWDLSVFAHPERAVALAALPESGDVPAVPAVDDPGAPPALEPSAAAVTQLPAAAGPPLDVGRMRDVMSRAVHVPFDLGRFRDAVQGAAGVAPAAEPPPRRAFPTAPPPEPAVAPVPAVTPAGRLAAVVAAVTADAPSPAARPRPALALPALPPPEPAAAPPEDPSAGNRAGLRAAFGLAANDTPAPPEPAPPPQPAPADHGQTIDIGAFRRAMRGATL